MRPYLTARLLVSAMALLGSGCVNGVRSGQPVVPGVAAPQAGPVAPPTSAPLPPPPPVSATPPAAPTVWRAEYYTISDG